MFNLGRAIKEIWKEFVALLFPRSNRSWNRKRLTKQVSRLSKSSYNQSNSKKKPKNY